MRYSANVSLLYPDRPTVQRIEQAAADGFTGIELLNPYELSAAELASVARANGVEVVLINSPVGNPGELGVAALPGRQDDFRAHLGQSLAVCEATGCRLVHLMAGAITGLDAGECIDALIDNLRWAGPEVAAAGVTITLEPLNRHDRPGYAYHLPSEAVAVIDEVGHPAVRLQLDLYHCAREHLDLAATTRAVLPLVRHVQVAGVDGRHEPDLAQPGLLDALHALEHGGYAGWLGFEYVPAGDTTAGLAWCTTYGPLPGRTG